MLIIKINFFFLYIFERDEHIEIDYVVRVVSGFCDSENIFKIFSFIILYNGRSFGKYCVKYVTHTRDM